MDMAEGTAYEVEKLLQSVLASEKSSLHYATIRLRYEDGGFKIYLYIDSADWMYRQAFHEVVTKFMGKLYQSRRLQTVYFRQKVPIPLYIALRDSRTVTSEEPPVDVFYYKLDTMPFQNVDPSVKS